MIKLAILKCNQASMFRKNNNFFFAKSLVLTVLVCLSSLTQLTFAEDNSLAVVPKVEFDKYLGLWYEVARKPMYLQKQCQRNATARYTINEFGNVAIDNRCLDYEGNEIRVLAEGYISNEPFNSKMKISFLPEMVRWIPLGREDYWILKVDKKYQLALVGEPTRKHLWLFSRIPHPDEALVNEYLRYAQTLGFDIQDLIRSPQAVEK